MWKGEITKRKRESFSAVIFMTEPTLVRRADTSKTASTVPPRGMKLTSQSDMNDSRFPRPLT